MPTLISQLEGLTAAEKATLKGEAWAETQPFSRKTVGDFEIEVTRIEAISKGVSVYARAWKDGKQIGFGDGSVDVERFRFSNPPIMVPTGSKTLATSSILGEIETDVFEENVPVALESCLEHTISVCGKVLGSNTIVPGKTGSTVSTFYPAAGSGGDSFDGRVDSYSGVSKSWATIRSENGVRADDTEIAGYVYVGATATANEFEILTREEATFPTGTLPNTDIIGSATVSWYGRGKSNGLGGTPAIGIYASNPSSDNSATASDYQAFGSTALSDATFTQAAWDTAAYNDFTLNADGLRAISKTGVTKLGFREAVYDVGGAAMPWVSAATMLFDAYAADEAGTTKDPKLVVTHASRSPGHNLPLMGAG